MESNAQLFSRGMPSLTPIAEAFRAQLIGGASEQARDFNADGNRAEPINDYRAREKKKRCLNAGVAQSVQDSTSSAFSSVRASEKKKC